MSNVGGIECTKKAMLCGVLQSIVPDEALVWSDALKMKKCKEMLLSLQRRLALRVISA